MKLTINSPKENFIQKYYETINGILNLSNRELEILAAFVKVRAELDDTLSDDQKDKITFSSPSRKEVSKSLNSSTFNVNNYIKMMRDKHILLYNKNKKILSVHPNVLVDLSGTKEITLKFNII